MTVGRLAAWVHLPLTAPRVPSAPLLSLCPCDALLVPSLCYSLCQVENPLMMHAPNDENRQMQRRLAMLSALQQVPRASSRGVCVCVAHAATLAHAEAQAFRSSVTLPLSLSLSLARSLARSPSFCFTLHGRRRSSSSANSARIHAKRVPEGSRRRPLPRRLRLQRRQQTTPFSDSRRHAWAVAMLAVASDQAAPTHLRSSLPSVLRRARRL